MYKSGYYRYTLIENENDIIYYCRAQKPYAILQRWVSKLDEVGDKAPGNPLNSLNQGCRSWSRSRGFWLDPEPKFLPGSGSENPVKMVNSTSFQNLPIEFFCKFLYWNILLSYIMNELKEIYTCKKNQIHDYCRLREKKHKKILCYKLGARAENCSEPEPKK